MVQRQKIHPEGPELSRLIWGAWRALDSEASNTPEKLLRIIETCLDLGITTIDHADIYGGYRVEALFGAALQLKPDLRNKLELVTKCGIALVVPQKPDHRIKHYNSSAAHIIASVERSLQNLGTDRVEMLLLHRPDPLLDSDEVAEALTRLVTAGKVRALGVSNYTNDQLLLLQSRLTLPLVTNQIEVSLAHTAPLTDGTLDHAQQQRMSPMIWSPLGGGKLLSDPNSTIGIALADMARRYGLDGPAAMAIAWLLRLPSKPLPILGSMDITRIRAMAAADVARLELQDWFALLEAADGREVP
jgi:predicted oxidoreductase